MAFHQISSMDVWDIIRRWHDRHSISQIARACSIDRKTVRGHIRRAQSVGLSLGKPLAEKEEVLRLLESVDQKIGRICPAQNALLPFLDEIIGLINDPQLAVKPKTAYAVICERHDLADKVSYPSFTRFIHANWPAIMPERLTCRIEIDPGKEAQVDYALVGLIFDPAIGHKRKLFAFIGTLSHSRMKHIELTFRQDQRSFVCSHVRMFEFFGGVPERIIIDNLKSGIIKPDLYDPRLNRTYREMSEHYGCFIDPARVARPRDKAKVERDVQTVREAARAILIQHPGATLAELNRHMAEWSMNQYGQKEHGTTHQKPFAVLMERERPALKALPDHKFEPAEWKLATVHPDHYLQFRGKAYSVPGAYVGKTVWVRASEHVLKVFFNERLIKQHLITRNYRHTDYEDFPENVRSVLDTSYIHKKLLERASVVGPHFHDLLHGLFRAHAFINLRRCQGLVALADACKDNALVERAAIFLTQHHISATPQNFRRLLAKLQAETSTPNLLPLSEATSQFVRDITYFINNNERIPS